MSLKSKNEDLAHQNRNLYFEEWEGNVIGVHIFPLFKKSLFGKKWRCTSAWLWSLECIVVRKEYFWICFLNQPVVHLLVALLPYLYVNHSPFSPKLVVSGSEWCFITESNCMVLHETALTDDICACIECKLNQLFLIIKLNRLTRV